MFEYRTDKVDLTLYPTVVKSDNAETDANSIKSLVIGDIHGNALKLLHLLIKYDVIAGLDSDDYMQFYLCYCVGSRHITKQVVDVVSDLFLKIRIKPNRKLILLGDEFSDRGKTDLWNIILFKALFRANIDLSVVLSNHGYQFIKYSWNEFKLGKNKQLIGMDISKKYTKSVYRFQKNIRKGLATVEDTQAFLNNDYRPKLKAIHYQVDRQNNHITLFTHAPVDLAIIKMIAEQMELVYDDSTLDALCNTIDKINSMVNLSISLEQIDSLIQQKPEDQNGLYLLIWNRDYDRLDRKIMHNGYTVHYAHGHDLKSSAIQRNHDNGIYCLDDRVGKGSGSMTGVVSILTQAVNMFQPQPNRNVFFNTTTDLCAGVEKRSIAETKVYD